MTDALANDNTLEAWQARVPELLAEMNDKQEEVNRWQRKQTLALQNFQRRVKVLPRELHAPLAQEQLALHLAAERLALAKGAYQQSLDELEALSEAIHRRQGGAEEDFIFTPGMPSTWSGRQSTCPACVRPSTSSARPAGCCTIGNRGRISVISAKLRRARRKCRFFRLLRRAQPTFSIRACAEWCAGL